MTSETFVARKHERRSLDRYYSQQSNAIYRLQMRECVMRMTTQGQTDKEIAAYLGQSPSTIRRFRDEARAQAIYARDNFNEVYDLRADPPPPDPDRRDRRGTGPGPHVKGSVKRHPATVPLPTPQSVPRRRSIQEAIAMNPAQNPNLGPDPSPNPGPPDDASSEENADQIIEEIFEEPVRILVKTGITVVDPLDVEDPEDLVRIRNACLDGRKAMKTFREIAEDLHISERQVRAHTAAALRDLQDSVTSHADLERRLMVEQIDDMIRAIRPDTVVTDGKSPVLEAIDRMLKLMDRKAKLLGLDQAEPVDIMIKLQDIASESRYNIHDLQDIARDVLAKHRIKLPMGAFEQDMTDTPETHPAESSPTS